MSGVEVLPIGSWSGPFDPELRQRAVGELESGRVLLMPQLEFALSQDERAHVEAAVQAGGGEGAKNVSYDPKSGECKAGPLSEDLAAAMAEPLARFSRMAATLIQDLFPGYAAGLELGRASFRPVEVEGRSQSWRKDDRRLHVDAFPSRPMRGRRILRVFSNVNPQGQPRRWRLGEPFEDHARRFLPRLPRPSRSRAWMLSRLGVTHGLQTPYDQLMLGLHDAAKRDLGYQETADAVMQDFPAGSSWIVYTDQTPHAALGGKGAFEQTLYLPPDVMADPGTAPVAVLERLVGRPML
jgi:hypothetical protein